MVYGGSFLRGKDKISYDFSYVLDCVIVHYDYTDFDGCLFSIIETISLPNTAFDIVGMLNRFRREIYTCTHSMWC